MYRFPVRIVAAAIGLAGISTALPAASPPPDGGTISIEKKVVEGDDSPATPMFVDAAGEALAEKGFTILQDPGHAAYVAELTLRRVEVGTGSAKVRAGSGTTMPGGAHGSVGAGVVIPLSTGKSTLVPLHRIELDMRIVKRGEDAVIWHGSAVTVRAAAPGKDADEAAVRDLSKALLRSYPVESEGAVSIP
jgi:hypothetical protein